MPHLRAYHFTAPNTSLQPLTRGLPQPGPGAVRVRIQACGICHGDALAVSGHFPGIAYPIIPGHEIAGVIDAAGSPLPPGANWKPGDRVAIGWNGGYCGQCAQCRRGQPLDCLTEHRVTGLTQDGGYATHVIARVSALARIPDTLTPEEAARLMCAGLTTFNALRHTHASGTAADGEDTMRFAALTGIRSMNEVYPLSEAPAAFDRMMSGRARFRVVLRTEE